MLCGRRCARGPSGPAAGAGTSCEGVHACEFSGFLGPGGGSAVRGLSGRSLASCGFCCLRQGDGEFGDAVGVDDVPADAPGDAVDDAVGGEGRLGGGG